MSKDEKPAPEIELRPDGWERFRRTVHGAAKIGPRPLSEKPKLRPARKARVRKGKARG